MSKEDKREYRAVTKRDKVCIFCGSHITHRHHIIHRSHGGITHRKNMVLLCKKHHDMVHSDEKKWKPYLLDRMRSIYGCIEEEDLKKKGNYANFAFPK